VAVGSSFFGALTNFSFAQLLASTAECVLTNHGGGPPALSQTRNQARGADMNPKSLIKLIKKAQRESPPDKSETVVVSDENRWSRAVRSWVSDFQQNATKETLPAFDRLFKDAS
jgi:hypothetical protein